MKVPDYIAGVWRDAAEQQRLFADLALCDAARNDHLRWAAKFDWLADTCNPIEPIDYSAITRDISYLS